jgi:hypothetical protein
MRDGRGYIKWFGAHCTLHSAQCILHNTKNMLLARFLVRITTKNREEDGNMARSMAITMVLWYRGLGGGGRRGWGGIGRGGMV